MSNDWVIGAGTTVYGLASIAGVLFIITYSVMTKWWRSKARREALYIVGLSLILSVLFGYLWAANVGVIGSLDGDPRRGVFRLIIACAGLFVLLGLGVLLLWAQTEQRRKARLLLRSRKDDHGRMG